MSTRIVRLATAGAHQSPVYSAADILAVAAFFERGNSVRVGNSLLPGDLSVRDLRHDTTAAGFAEYWRFALLSVAGTPSSHLQAENTFRTLVLLARSEQTTHNQVFTLSSEEAEQHGVWSSAEERGSARQGPGARAPTEFDAFERTPLVIRADTDDRVPATTMAPAARRVMHPIRSNTDRLLYVSLGQQAGDEVRALRRALPSLGIEFIGNSAHNGSLTRAGRTFDLRVEADVRAYLEGVAPTPPAALINAVVAHAMTLEDAAARDEFLRLSERLHQSEAAATQTPSPRGAAQRRPAGPALTMLGLGGHSDFHSLWGDNNGRIPFDTLHQLFQLFPATCRQVRTVYLAACNSLHPQQVEAFLRTFPNLERAGGYRAGSPGTYVGAIPQLTAWFHLAMEGTGRVSSAALGRELGTMGASGQRFATRWASHMATWNADDGEYQTFSFESAGLTPEHRPLNEASSNARSEDQLANAEGLVRELLSGHLDMFSRTLPDEKSPGPLYLQLTSLLGTGRMSLQTFERVRAAQQLALCARFYPNIVERFVQTNTMLIRAAQAELSTGTGATFVIALTGPNATRASQLEVVVNLNTRLQQLRNAGHTCPNAERLLRLMQRQIERLEDIPTAWL